MAKFKFSTNSLFFWLRGSIEIDETFVKVKTRNNILGFIPSGTNSESIPLKNISSCKLTTRFKVLRIIIGAFLFLGGIVELGSKFGYGILLLCLGFALFGSGLKTVLTIQRAGNDYDLSVPFYSKGSIAEAKVAIEVAIKENEN